MGWIDQIAKEVLTFHFCLRLVYHMIARLSLTLTRKPESLVGKTLKSSTDAI